MIYPHGINVVFVLQPLNVNVPYITKREMLRFYLLSVGFGEVGGGYAFKAGCVCVFICRLEHLLGCNSCTHEGCRCGVLCSPN